MIFEFYLICCRATDWNLRTVWAKILGGKINRRSIEDFLKYDFILGNLNPLPLDIFLKGNWTWGVAKTIASHLYIKILFFWMGFFDPSLDSKEVYFYRCHIIVLFFPGYWCWKQEDVFWYSLMSDLEFNFSLNVEICHWLPIWYRLILFLINIVDVVRFCEILEFLFRQSKPW